MFKRGATNPQKKEFSLTGAQILEDIKSISSSEEQRNKLYYCLEEKPPQEHKFAKIEEFLKGTQDLEDISEKLADLTYDIEALKKEIVHNLDDLQIKAREALRKDLVDV